MEKDNTSKAFFLRQKKNSPLSLYCQVLLNTSNDAVHILDESGNLVDANEKFCHLLGYSNEEIQQLHVSDWDAIWEKGALQNKIATLINVPAIFETKHRCKNGECIDVEINAVGIQLEGYKYLYAAARDITQRKLMDETLKNDKRRLFDILNGTNAATWEWNVKTGATIFNERWAGIIGYTLEEISPVSIETWKKFTHPDDFKKAEAILNKHFAHETNFYQCDMRMKHRDGHWVWVTDRGCVHEWDTDGKPLLMSGTHLDISESKKTEAALQKSDINLRHAQETAKIGSWEWDFVTDKITNSAEIFNIFGIEDEQFDGSFTSLLEKVVYPEDKHIVKAAAEHTLQTGVGQTAEYRIVRPDGSIRWIKAIGDFVYENGKPIKMLGLNQNITEQKMAIIQQKEALDKLIKIAKQVPGVVYQYRLKPDGSSCFPYASESIKSIYGLSPEEVIDDASKVFEKIHPDDIDAVVESIKVSAKNLSQWQIEYRVKFEDDSIRVLYGNSVPEKEADGSILWHGFITDITEYNKTRERMRQLSVAVEQSPFSIVITDTKGNIEYVNNKFVDITGYSFEEAKGQNPRILKSGDKTQEDYKKIWDTLTTAKPWKGEFHNKKKNGDLYWESAKITPILDAKGNTTHFLAIKEDITEQKKAEEKIYELYRDFINFLENTTDFIYYKDINSRFRFCSQTLANITGHKHWKDMIGKHDLEVFPRSIAEIYAEEEIPILRDGTPLLDKTDPYLDTLGNTKWVNTNKWPLFDAEGNVTGLFGISRDITANKAKDEMLKQYVNELKASNADLENFAYIASHDLQEPLRMIDSFLHLLEKKIPGKAEDNTHEYIHYAIEGATRMKILINDLLQYSRVGTNKEEFTAIDINELLSYMLRVLSEPIDNSKAEITIKQMPIITANKTLITELFQNLITNAIKYQHHGTVPKIEIGYKEEPGHYLLYIKDNGIGIMAVHFEKIFEVFQRLHSKSQYSGTGIGLALCKKIVEIHKGKIWVDSTFGEGSTFYFTLKK
jgi:PAS domain S-box-containing protein